MSTISYHQDILDKFKQTYERDQNFIKDWIVTWEYQDRRKKRKVNYGEGLPEEFYVYDGPEDLGQWVNWMLNVEKSNFINSDQFKNWSKISIDLDEKVFEDIKYKYDVDTYSKGLGVYNAQDFFFANLIPYPNEDGPLKVLDFGAGFGRQANLWTRIKPDTIYVGMDAIPKSYCLQHYYYSQTGKFQQDYVLDPENFSLENAQSGIHHLPTWRWDLIPDNYFDKILLVQVLQELNVKLVKEMINTFHRILKPGGSIYIRDNDTLFRPAHRLDSNKLLEDVGFVLEYKPHLLPKKELHGIPRVWRKIRPEVIKSQEIPLKQRMKEWAMDVDAMTNGKLKAIAKKIVNK